MGGDERGRKKNSLTIPTTVQFFPWCKSLCTRTKLQSVTTGYSVERHRLLPQLRVIAWKDTDSCRNCGLLIPYLLPFPVLFFLNRPPTFLFLFLLCWLFFFLEKTSKINSSPLAMNSVFVRYGTETSLVQFTTLPLTVAILTEECTLS